MATNPIRNYKYAIVNHEGYILERTNGRRALYSTYKQALKQHSGKDDGWEIVELWFKRHNNNSVEK